MYADVASRTRFVRFTTLRAISRTKTLPLFRFHVHLNREIPFVLHVTVQEFTHKRRTVLSCIALGMLRFRKRCLYVRFLYSFVETWSTWYVLKVRVTKGRLSAIQRHNIADEVAACLPQAFLHLIGYYLRVCCFVGM